MVAFSVVLFSLLPFSDRELYFRFQCVTTFAASCANTINTTSMLPSGQLNCQESFFRFPFVALHAFIWETSLLIFLNAFLATSEFILPVPMCNGEVMLKSCEAAHVAHSRWRFLLSVIFRAILWLQAFFTPSRGRKKYINFGRINFFAYA